MSFQKNSDAIIFIHTESKVSLQALRRYFSLYFIAENIELFSDERQLLARIKQRTPTTLLIASQQLPKSANPFGDYMLRVKSLLIAVRQIVPQIIIFARENSDLITAYFEAGIDYFVYDSAQLPAMIFKLTAREPLSIQQSALITSKIEFYRAVHDIFNFQTQLRANTAQEISFLRKIILENGSSSVLDAGCGEGRLSIPLAKECPRIRFDGLDVNEQYLNVAKTNTTIAQVPNINFRLGSLLQTPYGNKQFDTIFMMWHVICDLCNHQDALLREMHRLLTNSGILIFDFPDRLADPYVKSDGVSEDVRSGFPKYIGLVPEIKTMLDRLKLLGFERIEYHRVVFGTAKLAKFIVIARKKAGWI